MTNLTPDIATKNKRKRSIIFFLGSLVVALTLTFLLKEPSFTDSQVYVLFLLFFAIGLWITEAIPPFAVGLFIIAYLVYTFGNPNLNSTPEKIDRYVTTFASSIIWLLLGGFFMAAAMTKTGLDKRLLGLTLKLSGTKPTNILIAVMFTTLIFSMLMSYIATAAMMLAATMPLLRSLGKSNFSKALLLGISLAAAIGAMGTIIASSSNAVAAGLIEDAGLNIDFLTWMKYGLPIAILLTALCCYILNRLFIKKAERVSLDFLMQDFSRSSESNTQRMIVSIIVIITILFWMTTSIHGIRTAAISAIPIVGLTLTSVLSADDIKKMPWDTLFLVAGGLSLGEAIESTEILNHYISQLQNMSISPYLLILILAYIAMTFSNVSSNIAACMLLIPLGMSLMPAYKTEVAIAVALSSSSCVFLPISNPPNLIVYSTGLLEQKDFRIGGLIVGLLGPLLAVLWVLLMH
jgi:sodium-dependent dicarboxylate transporter 2/3/5